MARFFLFFWLLLFCSLSPSVFAADGPFLPSNTGSSHQDKLARGRLEIERLKDSIDQQRNLRREDEEQARTILAKLEEIDQRLAERTSKIDDFGKQIAGQEEVLRKLGAELDVAAHSKDEAMNHLMRRIRAFYPVGKVGLLRGAFSRENLPDLLKFHEAFTHLIHYDEHALADYRKKYEQLRSAQEHQRQEQRVLQDFLASMKEEQSAIEGLKQEQESLLEQVRTKVELRQRVIEEMGAETAQMTASLKVGGLKDQDTANDFRRLKAKLPPPLQGPIICRFGAATTDKMGITKKSLGLVFAAHDGDTVQAVASGVVTFAGYLRGYGNTVIIEHGQDFFTVTARLERLSCAQGDSIKAGAAIGIAGNTAMLVDEGVYFELRANKEAIDPLPWFNNNQISFATLPGLQ